MANRKYRVLGLRISAIAAAGVLGLTSMMGRPAIAFAADTALIMGGSGLPVPTQSYMDATEQVYLAPNGYGGYTPQALITPEQLYPITGVNSMTADASVAQGVTILDNAIRQHIAAGNRVVVFGYSQGAAVASQESARLTASGNPPTSDQVSFVLVGDPSNPNGGINQRFTVPGVPLSLPTVGQTFNYAPAASNTYPTAIYTQEYDGFADFPQYPLNLLSVLNAYVGVFTQHFSYLDLTPQQMSSAVALPTTGNTTTRYYMIPTGYLPLLAPVRLIPLIGKPLADLLQPDLRVLVNLGYGSITNGWSPGPADVPTPFGLFPTDINPADVLAALAKGAIQGVTDALNDLKTPTLIDTSSFAGFAAGFHTIGVTTTDSPSLLQVLSGFTAFGNGGVPVSNNGDIVDTITKVVSDDIAVVRPFVDSAIALGIGLPKYDAQLFTSQLRAGHLLNAVAMPIAADIGLAPFLLITGAAFPIVNAIANTVTQLAELARLEPNPTPAAGTATTAAATAGTSTAPTRPLLRSATTKLAGLAEFARVEPRPTGTAVNTNAGSALSASAGTDSLNTANGGAQTGTGLGDRVRAAALSAITLVKGGVSGISESGTGASSTRAPSMSGLTADLGKAVAGIRAHAQAVNSKRDAPGASGSTHGWAGTLLHHAHV